MILWFCFKYMYTKIYNINNSIITIYNYLLLHIICTGSERKQAVWILLLFYPTGEKFSNNNITWGIELINVFELKSIQGDGLIHDSEGDSLRQQLIQLLVLLQPQGILLWTYGLLHRTQHPMWKSHDSCVQVNMQPHSVLFRKYRVTHLLVSLYLCDQQEFVKQEQIDIYKLCVLWWQSAERRSEIWLK